MAQTMFPKHKKGLESMLFEEHLGGMQGSITDFIITLTILIQKNYTKGSLVSKVITFVLNNKVHMENMFDVA